LDTLNIAFDFNDLLSILVDFLIDNRDLMPKRGVGGGAGLFMFGGFPRRLISSACVRFRPLYFASKRPKGRRSGLVQEFGSLRPGLSDSDFELRNPGINRLAVLGYSPMIGNRTFEETERILKNGSLLGQRSLCL